MADLSRPSDAIAITRLPARPLRVSLASPLGSREGRWNTTTSASNPNPSTRTPRDPTLALDLWDEDKFEGISVLEAIPSDDSVAPAEADQSDPSIEAPAETIPTAKRSPAELLRAFSVEIACVSFLIYFVLNYFMGKRQNENIALAWATKFTTRDSIFDKNFSLLGTGDGKDSGHIVKDSNSDNIEKVCHLCFGLLDRVFERIQVLTVDPSQSNSEYLYYPAQHIQNIVDSVLRHPVITLSLSCSLSNCQNLAYGSLEHLEEALAIFATENLHLIDRFVLNLLALSETDLEIFHLMNEIESPVFQTITEVDHLWGASALKFREELKLDFSKSDTHNTENAEITEKRRALFRENIPVDSKLCAKTSLLYCYKRSTRASVFSLEQLQRDNFADSFEGIPLFPTLLQSSSVHFKAERLWMLRLLSAGSNLADDAKIYKRGRVLELALAFCSSPVSDFESKVLVLKVLENCVKLPVLAHHLEIGIIDCCCKQHAKLVDQALASGKIYDGDGFNYIKESFENGTLHLIRLLSDGGVHSRLDQLQLLLKGVSERGAKKFVCTSLPMGVTFLDGSNVGFVETLENDLLELRGKGIDAQIASGGGRMYVTMDRYENDWDVVKRGWDA
uniref:Uncharacterized protein n=1 Tax=Zea mays TaxID=4577 RepID=A0A804PMF6_MAIZE